MLPCLQGHTGSSHWSRIGMWKRTPQCMRCHMCTCSCQLNIPLGKNFVCLMMIHVFFWRMQNVTSKLSQFPILRVYLAYNVSVCVAILFMQDRASLVPSVPDEAPYFWFQPRFDDKTTSRIRKHGMCLCVVLALPSFLTKNCKILTNFMQNFLNIKTSSVMVTCIYDFWLNFLKKLSQQFIVVIVTYFLSVSNTKGKTVL